MTGAIKESPPAHYDEKHLESKELEGSSHSHQEVADASSNEAGLHESEKEVPMTFRRFMGFTSMAFLWTGSQIPVYLFGTTHFPKYSEFSVRC
jgi:hypothetical protein